MRTHLSFAAVALRAVAVSVCLTLSAPVLADPPDHAPAHGWRKKNDPRYVGYTGKEWSRDYGIIEGRCNREEIGTVLGAVAGGAIGSQIGDGSGRAVAIVVGAVLGAAIGREIGQDLDDRDRACVGHALELSKAGQSVRWVNDVTRVTYVLKPLGAMESGTNCRRYEINATRDGKSKTSPGKACRKSDGTWTVVPLT